MFGKAFKATFGVGCALVVGLFALVLISGALVNGSGQVRNVLGSISPRASAAPTAQRSWVVVNHWSGSGIKDTEKFTVGDEWRIDWDFTPGQYGLLQIYVYNDAGMAGLAANTQQGGPDTSFQHKAGTYYLKVNALGPWKVVVQDMR